MCTGVRQYQKTIGCCIPCASRANEVRNSECECYSHSGTVILSFRQMKCVTIGRLGSSVCRTITKSPCEMPGWALCPAAELSWDLPYVKYIHIRSNTRHSGNPRIPGLYRSCIVKRLLCGINVFRTVAFTKLPSAQCAYYSHMVLAPVPQTYRAWVKAENRHPMNVNIIHIQNQQPSHTYRMLVSYTDWGTVVSNICEHTSHRDRQLHLFRAKYGFRMRI